MSRKRSGPPRPAAWLLKLAARDRDSDYALGDLREAFEHIAATQGTTKARLWFWKEVLKSLPGFLANSIVWRGIMIRNYMKSGFRNLARSKSSSFINIAGLAVGMACSLLIFLWVDGQMSVDRGQENADRITRLEATDWVEMPTIFRTHLEGLSGIREVTRFYTYPHPSLQHREKLFEMDDLVFADNNIFDVFTFAFVKGDRDSALDAPFSVVLTESWAEKIFGDDDPIGRTLKYDNTFDFMVTGVIDDQEAFHIRIDALASFQSLPAITGQRDFLEKRNKWNFLTYLLLADHTDIPQLEGRINQTLKRGIADDDNEYILRPFGDIYFAGGLIHEVGVRHGDLELVILFSAIALAIMLIACFNYINLTTARSAHRAREICVRKVIGAHRKSLILQFSIEMLITLAAAAALCLLLVHVFLPAFNRLTGEKLAFDYADPVMIAGGLFILLFSGMLAGAFPSLYLSSFSPVGLLQGKGFGAAKKISFRKALVIVQFAVSIFLIIGTLTVFRQIRFMQRTELGFTKDHVVNVNLKGDLLSARKWAFKQLLRQNPNVLGVSFSDDVPGKIINTHTWDVRGEPKPMTVIDTDPDYIDLMGLTMAKGRKLSWRNRTDFARKIIINQEAVRYLGFESAIGERVGANFGPSQIVGVVKDFHFNSLQQSITPLAICWYDPWATKANIKISGDDIDGTLGHIRDVWQRMAPGFPFAFSFLDESFDEHYRTEKRTAGIMQYFAVLAILLANLGLMGLAALVAERRTKEIGIRKTLGASATSIVLLLSKEFSRWILIANLIAWPLAYWVMHRWLQGFAYRCTLAVWLFLISGLAAFAVAYLTVGLQSLKEASANPVDALRYE